jgi:hypothetical protein
MVIERAKDRGLLWWITAILAPVGVVGGPLAIADLVSGVIEWHGWIGFLVSFWEEKVSGPFGAVFGVIFDLLRLPRLSEAFVDYLTIGVLASSSFFRAATLFYPFDQLNLGSAQRFKSIVIPIFIAVSLPLWAVLWPILVFSILVTCIGAYWSTATTEERKIASAVLVYSLAPFAIFALLWALNTFVTLPGHGT